MKSFKQIIKESDESKKDFLKYVDNYKNVVSKAFDFDKKAVQAGNPIDIKGMQSWITAYHSSMERYNNAVKNKTLTESKKLDYSEIDLENIAGGIKVSDGYDGLYVQSYSGGSGFNKLWKSDEFLELVKQSQEKRDYRPIRLKIEAITNDLLKVANDFDKGIESVMKKHGFKK